MANKERFKQLIGDLLNSSSQDIEKEKQIHITILPELQAFIPPLTGEEYRILETSIITEGCRESLIIWKKENDFVLVDGHNRYTICQKYNIPFTTKIKNFNDIDAVKDWMITNQLGKRNVTEEVKSYLRGLQYRSEKSKIININNLKQFKNTEVDNLSTHKNTEVDNLSTSENTKVDNLSSHKNTKVDNLSTSINNEVDKLSTSIKTSQKLAEQHKVSQKTIQRDEKFADNLDMFTGNDKNLQWKILHKEILISKTDLEKIVKLPIDEIQQIKNELKESGKFSFPKNNTSTQENEKEVTKLFNSFLKTRNPELIEQIHQILKNMLP